MSDSETPKTKTLTKEVYYQYGYHRNVVFLLESCEKSLSPKAKEKLNESRTIKTKIENEIWKIRKAEAAKKQEGEEEQSLIQPVQTQTENANEIANGFEVLDKWLTGINMARIELGVVRNIFTFCLENNFASEYTKDINRDSSLLASYLYPIRLINETIKVLTYAWQNATAEIPWIDVISGYYKTHWKKFINDCFWSVLLLFLNLSVYIKDAATQALLQNEITGLIFSWIIAGGFLFDVLNELTIPNKLERDYIKLKNELGSENIPSDLETVYEKRKKENYQKVTELSCYFGLFTAYAVFDLVSFTANLSPHITTGIFPWVELTLTICMFFIRVYFICCKLGDEDFKTKLPDEQMKIQLEVYSALVTEVLKIIAVSILIFLVASTLPFGGVPAMLALGVILFAFITATNLITKHLIEPYVLKPLLQSNISTNPLDGSSPTPTHLTET
jgi:hypothetical protein